MTFPMHAIEINVVVAIMNKRYECFVSEMRACGSLRRVDISLSFPRLLISLYDDYESPFPIEPNFMVSTCLAGLEEVIDPPLTSLPFVARSLSSAPRDTIVGVLSLLSSPLPFAPGMG